MLIISPDPQPFRRRPLRRCSGELLLPKESHEKAYLLTPPQVYEPGSAISSTGALTAYSGAKTGRSPLDKRIVQEEGSEKEIWYVRVLVARHGHISPF